MNNVTGKTVIVNKKVENGKAVSTRSKVYNITNFINPQKVIVSSGDIWKVKPYQGKEADYVIVPDNTEI